MANTGTYRHSLPKLTWPGVSKEVKTIWYSRDEEPDEVETFPLECMPWLPHDAAQREIDADCKRLSDRLLCTLSPRARLVVERRYFDDATVSEIAYELGVGRQHVHMMIQRALSKMRVKLHRMKGI